MHQLLCVHQTSTSHFGLMISIDLCTSQCAEQVLAIISTPSRGKKSTKLHVHFCLNSAGKHGTLTSGFSNVTSTARAVGVKKVRLCAGLFSTAQHAQRGKLLICLLCLPLLLVSGFCKQRVSCRRTSIIMFLFSFSVTKKMPLKMLLNKESLAKQHKIAANTKTLQSQSD